MKNRMKTFYLAASYPRKDEAIIVRDQLLIHGFECTSRWLDGRPGEGYEKGVSAMPSRFAIEDAEDVVRGDFLVSLTGDTKSRGGRHTELGIAIALGKRCFLLGELEQVFHHHPLVAQVFSVSSLVGAVRDGIA